MSNESQPQESPKRLIISDPEGHDLKLLLNNPNFKPNEKNKVIILGDVIDSTNYNGNQNEPGLHPDNTVKEEYKKVRCYNIRNLLFIKENQPHVQVTYGNRDLNKVKCLALLQFADGTKWWEKTLDMLLDDNFTLNDNSWKVTDKELINNWNTYWKGPKWDPTPIGAENTFLRRYYLIFGIDNTNGTMSAHENIHAIYDELKQTKQIDLPKDLDENKDDNDDVKKQKLEKKAKICLAVYMRMLYPTKSVKEIAAKFEKKNYNNPDYYSGNTQTQHGGGQDLYYFCNGLLNHLYTDPHNQAIIVEEKRNDVNIFSHGGITNKFIEHYKKYKKETFDADFEPLKKSIPYFQQHKGGYYRNDLTKEISFEDLKTCADNYNAGFNNKVNDMYQHLSTYENKSTDVNFNQLCQTIMELGHHSVPHNGKISEFSMKNVGPIMPGLPSLRGNESFLIEGKTVRQFIGHVPLGIGAVIDLYQNNNKRQSHYIINCDINNIVLRSPHLDFSEPTNNYLYFELMNDNTINQHYQAKYNPKIFKQPNNNKNGRINPIKIYDSVDNKYETQNMLNLTNNTVTINTDDIIEKYTKCIKVSKQNDFHGIMNINNTEYCLFSYTANWTQYPFVIEKSKLLGETQPNQLTGGMNLLNLIRGTKKRSTSGKGRKTRRGQGNGKAQKKSQSKGKSSRRGKKGSTKSRKC